MKTKLKTYIKKSKKAVLKIILASQKSWLRAGEIQQKVDDQKTETLLKYGTGINRFY